MWHAINALQPIQETDIFNPILVYRPETHDELYKNILPMTKEIIKPEDS